MWRLLGALLAAWATAADPPTVAASLVSGDAPRNLLLSKCCPANQQLDRTLRGCVAYDGTGTGNGTGPSADPEQAFDLLARSADGGGGGPWWLSPNLLPTLLEGQSEGSYVRFNASAPCPFSEMKHVNAIYTDQYMLLHNGTLLLTVANSDNQTQQVAFGPEEYCVDRVDVPAKSIFLINVCPCRKVLCVNKCCSKSKMLVVEEFRKTVVTSCVKNGTDIWTPTFFSYENKTVPANETVVFTVLDARMPECPKGFTQVLLNSKAGADGSVLSFWTMPNGSVLVDNYGHGRAFPRERICGDRARLDDGTLAENALFCHAVATDGELTAESKFYGSMFVIGAFFLALTLFVYGALPELRSTPHAKALVCHTAAQLVASLALGTGQLQTRMPLAVCYSVAFIVQFSFLAAFFWLNVMCIDIAWAFSGLRALAGSISDRDRRKFLYYSLYAWGGPALISLATAVLEFVEGLPPSLLRPNFGVQSCWFETKLATFAFFYGPMAALLLANLALFVFTTLRILKVQRDTAILTNGESGRHDGNSAFKKDKKRLVLYLKLFCLMGVTWMTEIISWAQGETTVYWYVTDFINLLRGLFIFVIFCCKRKVLLLLRARLSEWGLLRCCGLSAPASAAPGDPGRKSSGSTQQSSLQLSQLGDPRASSPQPSPQRTPQRTPEPGTRLVLQS